MGRVGTAKEVASAVVFFASNEAGYITLAKHCMLLVVY
jgi:NAD(P)-dependent dehydrogenase (short-subunit alcohol dehydrogenase family)